MTARYSATSRKMRWLVVILSTITIISASADEHELSTTVKLLQEQVGALLDHRQEEYDALENSLKRSIEKNTELIVLKNEVKQLRKEVTLLRGGSGNEAKNEKLRVRWLGSAVTELQSEVAEVLRTRNASEELAERARMRSELALLRGDVAEVGRGMRNLGARMTRLEATLSTIRMDIATTKDRSTQISRSCADVVNQLSAVQIEMKSLKCGSDMSESYKHNPGLQHNNVHDEIRKEYTLYHHRHGFLKSSMNRKIEERLLNLEHKIAVVSRKRGLVENRVIYENQDYLTKRLSTLESMQHGFARQLFNVTREVTAMSKLRESMVEIFESIQAIEDKVDTNQPDMKREIARLDVNAARKAAELSLTREELGNLRRTVQALSVSASKLQEKSDQQQDIIANINSTLTSMDLTQSLDTAANITHELEHVEDQYRLIVDTLPGNCNERDGLTLLAPGPGAPLLASCNKGWIVVARRIDGMVEFDRTWNEYAAGFGSPVNEFWVGNEALHKLTRGNCTRLKIDLVDIHGGFWRAEYDFFKVDSEEDGYRLHVSGYSGNATDALSYQNNMAFSAKDRDLDISSTDCAANYHGGWWFSHCQHANLNGRYSLGLTWFQSPTNEWMAVASSEMSIQRKQEC